MCIILSCTVAFQMLRDGLLSTTYQADSIPKVPIECFNELGDLPNSVLSISFRELQAKYMSADKIS